MDHGEACEKKRVGSDSGVAKANFLRLPVLTKED